MESYKEAGGEEVRIGTQNDTEIVGTFYDNPSNKGVILLPGFTEHRISLNELAHEVGKRGFKVWSFDLNSQGDSTGNWDLNDMIDSFNYISHDLRKRHGLKKMGGFGNSLGAMIIGINSAKNNESLEAIALSGAPTALQDVHSEAFYNLLEKVPQRVIRAGTIFFDKYQSLFNEKYRNLSHKKFKKNGLYPDYAQLGATKILDIKKAVEGIKKSPRLNDYAGYIDQPTLMVYGGEDRLLGIRNSKLPEPFIEMFRNISSKDKELLVVSGADHPCIKFIPFLLGIDAHYNADEEYSFVKPVIADHFENYLSDNNY